MFVVIGEYDDRTGANPPDLLASFQTFGEALNYIVSEYVTDRITYDHRKDPVKLKEEALNMWDKRADLVFNDYYWYIFDTDKPVQQKLARATKILPHYEPLRNDCSCDCIRCDEQLFIKINAAKDEAKADLSADHYQNLALTSVSCN